MRKLFVTIVILVAAAGLLIGCNPKPLPGTVKDEALRAGRTPESLPGADEDYYADMDYGLTKNPEAIRASLDPYVPGIKAADAVKAAVIGRNNWVVWTAGNDRIWDVLSVSSFGN